ncbi:MAG: acyl-ACP--UDP-N-acetylglucosamine O-acyltransferase [Proteobacteria bacterium]|nr:acyl-ACP--UDP-N-acetylglucosamine O-acyltransferase [Pseudomonadota bacterium]
MIHKTAIIDPNAEVDDGVEVGPYAIIGSGVKIGAGTVIGPHVLIKQDTFIGSDNIFEHGASIGGEPQDLSFKGQKTYVKIGNGNTFREFSTIHRATKKEGATSIGDNNYFMAYAHAGHDCQVGNSTIISNCTGLAGHVHVEDYAIISASVGIHQFVKIGTMAMVGALSRINRDVLPYTLVEGNPAVTRGLNSVGLRRKGYSAESRSALKKAYKILCRSDMSIPKALDKIVSEIEAVDELKHLIAFVKESQRGIIR